jgi:hypothetical protein
VSGDGFRARQRERARQRILDAVELEPGEELEEWTIAQVRPRLFLGLEALVGPLTAFAIRQYYVAATSRRLLALRMAKTSTTRLTLELAEPFDRVRIDRRKSGPLWKQFWVRRSADDSAWRFRVVRTEWSRAERVFERLTG